MHDGSNPEPSEDSLLASARGGDAAAVDALIERRMAQIYKFGFQMCRDPEDAKDVAQDTLLAFARGVHDFRGDSSLSTWLYKVARSHCIKKRRKRQGEPARFESVESDETHDLADGRDAPDEIAASRQIERVVDAAIRELDETSREVLILRDVEGLTAPEVAEVIGTSVQAVKSRLHRARLAVRERVTPALADESTSPVGTACPDVAELLSKHLEDEIEPEVCVAMEQHLLVCPRCKGRCDSLRRSLALCRGMSEGNPLPAALQSEIRTGIRTHLARS